MFEKEFLDLMPHTILVLHWLGESFEGDPIYADTVVDYRCRIVGKGIALRRQFSEDETVIYDLYIDSGSNVFGLNDKIILPEDDVWMDQTPLIFAVGRYPDEDSHHHTKIQCGWMYHRQGQ